MMKKAIVKSLTILGTVILSMAMTGCGSDSENVENSYQEGSSIEINSTETSETAEVHSTDSLETEEEIATVPENILYSFDVKINGESYHLPSRYQDFIDTGWELSGGSDTLAPKSSVIMIDWHKEFFWVGTEISNVGDVEIDIEDCLVTFLKFEEEEVLGNAADIEFPGGIKIGISTKEDILNMYGTPTFEEENDEYYELIYRKDFEQEVRFYFSYETGILCTAEMKNNEALVPPTEE